MNYTYVIHVKKRIGTIEEAYPIACRNRLKYARDIMLHYINKHKMEVANGDEWLAEETTLHTYNMYAIAENRATANKLEVRIYRFVQYIYDDENYENECFKNTSGGQPL